MKEETAAQRCRRYQNAEQCEVSDPAEWAAIHHGPAAEKEESMDESGEQEF